jgi:hypothetical protein
MERAALGLYSLVLTMVQPLLRFKLRKRGAHEPLYCVAVGERCVFDLFVGRWTSRFARNSTVFHVWWPSGLR